MEKRRKQTGASLLVDCLIAHKVKYVFGVPGASLMPILDVLHDRGPEFVVCRHEQNAAFMAQAWGRLTGQPGVCMATVGPGATNLVTGVATATADRDPLIAITGQTPLPLRALHHHQDIDAAPLFRPITKLSVEIKSGAVIPATVAKAFRTAVSPHQGAVHLAFPSDVLNDRAGGKPIVRPPVTAKPPRGVDLTRAAALLARAKRPVALIGVGASDWMSTRAVRAFLAATGIPAISTFEGAGVVGRQLLGQFLGRVGLAAVEPGDRALRSADVVIAIGYDVVEYAPSYWRTSARVIHIDRLRAGADPAYQPAATLVGSIGATLEALSERLMGHRWKMTATERNAQGIIRREQARGAMIGGAKIHPARLVAELRKSLPDDALMISDVGSHQIWLAREFYTFQPRSALFSMGFQTMGVALPWAIAARLAEPKRRIVSCSGDGSFLMSVMELETAVRRKLPLVHLVWRDGTYNLVEIQQRETYGRVTGTKFGNPDIVKLAQSFGATGLRISRSNDIAKTLARAYTLKGPVIIDVPVDYRNNLGLLGHGGLFGGRAAN
jgi:acetolactate synthase-1/2/3 large subunit